VEHKPVGLVTRDHCAELLESPVDGGMRGDMEVRAPAGSDLCVPTNNLICGGKARWTRQEKKLSRSLPEPRTLLVRV
jgi:hypothetical protein